MTMGTVEEYLDLRTAFASQTPCVTLAFLDLAAQICSPSIIRSLVNGLSFQKTKTI